MTDWLIDERLHIINKVQETLSSRGCAALLGELRMGKTSILQSLLEILPSPVFPFPGVYVSLAELESEHTIDADKSFYLKILQDLAADGETVAIPDEEMNVWDLYDWFKGSLKQQGPLAILIDDAERFETIQVDDVERFKALDGYRWGEMIFRHLGDLMADTDVSIVLAGTNRLERWVKEWLSREGKAGPWDSIQSPIVLGSVPLQTVRNVFLDDQELADLLIKLCGGHPYCLRRLTEDVHLGDIPDRRILNEIENKARDLENEWHATFSHYWHTYDHLTRQACFLLAAVPDSLTRQELKSKLSGVSKKEFKRTIAEMTSTGIMFEDTENKSLHLIELFRRWYKKEIGFVEGILSPPLLPEAIPITELTFFPNQDLVLIRRDRFLYSSKLGLTPKRVASLCKRARRVPGRNVKEFTEKIQFLSEDLWDRLEDQQWFGEVRDSVRTHHHLRFNVPVEMGEFPFELLPLDESGTRRIGMQVPISRQLVMEGQCVERAPLTLPREDRERLRVIVVASEVGGEIVIDADGNVYQGTQAQISRGESYTLAKLTLDREVQALYQILKGKAELIGDVIFLTNHETASIDRAPPTAEVFRKTLSDKQFDILHFVGHGLVVYDAVDTPRAGGLVFEDQIVHLADLADLLEGQEQLGFVYLSCCESGRLDTGNRTSDLLGLSQACVEAGVPAVLGMRWRIPVITSRMLTEAFYPALFQEGTLDKALHSAVRVVNKQSDPSKRVYAAAPVLIMH